MRKRCRRSWSWSVGDRPAHTWAGVISPRALGGALGCGGRGQRSGAGWGGRDERGAGVNIGIFLLPQREGGPHSEERRNGRHRQAAWRVRRSGAVEVGGGDGDVARAISREVDDADPPEGLLYGDTAERKRQPIEGMRRIDDRNDRCHPGCAFYGGLVLVEICPPRSPP